MTSFEIKNQAALRTAESAVDAEQVDISTGNHEFGRSTRWLFVSYSGQLRVRMTSGVIADLGYLSYGVMLPISVTAVYQSGTDASGIWGMF